MPRGSKKRLSDDKILSLITSADAPAVTAVELAEVTDYTRQGIAKRLHQLKKEGRVGAKTVGSSAVIWWIPDGEDSSSAH